MATKTRPVTVIIPIYGALDDLKVCVQSLFEHLDTSVHKVMLVNDGGPEIDAVESAMLKMIDGKANYEYHRNKKNLGFLGNCNNAVMNLDNTDNDIILLNSDAKVTPGFIQEMLDVLYAPDQKIGAVSPRSNNATIATMPISAIHQKGIDRAKAYKFFLRVKNKMPQYTFTPTAHGFCILIKRSLIKKYGLFDKVFGKGYGEEVDFCQRIRSKGYKCALANHAFVYHMEARSFSFEKKAKLLEVNNVIIRQRYPDYQKEVADYIKTAIAIEPKLGLSDRLLGGLRKLK